MKKIKEVIDNIYSKKNMKDKGVIVGEGGMELIDKKSVVAEGARHVREQLSKIFKR